MILSAFWQTIEKDGIGLQYHADDVLGFTPNFGVARRGKMPRLRIWCYTTFRATEPFYFCTK
ncbi:MAG: hypothetical protein OXT74_17125, partial [Candidatus Poribacteria bacterium]|nr:hypothetical protein [Candidatus Poribacteria bacterium]